MGQKKLIIAAVVGHLMLTVLHGLVHAAIPVLPVGWEATFVVVVLYFLPVTGAGLVMRGHRRAGAAFLLGAGAAGFAFEGAFHFLIANPDHIAHVADHHMAFYLTGILTTASNLLLTGAALLSVRRVAASANDSNVTVEG